MVVWTLGTLSVFSARVVRERTCRISSPQTLKERRNVIRTERMVLRNVVIVVRQCEEPGIIAHLRLVHDPDRPVTGLIRTTAEAVSTWHTNRLRPIRAFGSHAGQPSPDGNLRRVVARHGITGRYRVGRWSQADASTHEVGVHPVARVLTIHTALKGPPGRPAGHRTSFHDFSLHLVCRVSRARADARTRHAAHMIQEAGETRNGLVSVGTYETRETCAQNALRA